MEILMERETLDTLRRYLPSGTEVRMLSDFFSLFSDQTRLKIISALSISKMCVSDLVAVLAMNQTTCSHQLKILRSADIVDFERCGKVLLYYLKNPAVCDVLLSAVKYLRL
ncbi:MAG TPA: metalloregulator ArsR/SmtB family transcription factor [Eubacteriales bacterium]|jgi:ArsR family transcriptional regulator|nr:metalloregulator ArsR/SmtB family transcription factor [Clostridia bacterium]HRR89822.1 metalloregulator ArsR/SmtB family transcription factor [Eubacteriales bacterium]HRU84873.1 metalloregulator ArsR/SmtB family transcription factor [Eubacteriales bacterium]